MEINQKLQTCKQGIDFVRTLIDINNCFFHEIQQENDLGIDAIIELSNNGVMSGASFAVQIKTGYNYINYKNNRCHFSIGKHKNYWISYSLPVYGFVCDVERKCYYYVNIKDYIRAFESEIQSGGLKSIIFDIAFYNTITIENFDNLFRKPFLNVVPFFAFKDAKNLLHLDSDSDIALGLHALRKYHYELEETWIIFLEFLRDDKFSFFHETLLNHFSIGTHNPDIWRTGEGYEVSSQLSENVIKTFTRKDIVRLLSMVDEENNFQRGSIGECVDFIIQEIPNGLKTVASIVVDKTIPLSIREIALYLLAFYDIQAFRNVPYKHELSNYNMLNDHIQTYGAISPYS